MKRKPGRLLSIELAVLHAAIGLVRTGALEFYGYAIAREIRDQEAARRLTAHGTLYRALERMEKLGLLTSRWEDPAAAAAEQRPLRRLYQVTAAGETAARDAIAAEAQQQPAAAPRQRRLSPS
jgi:DNA-binding PadR family transcriptional regulator